MPETRELVPHTEYDLTKELRYEISEIILSTVPNTGTLGRGSKMVAFKAYIRVRKLQKKKKQVNGQATLKEI